MMTKFSALAFICLIGLSAASDQAAAASPEELKNQTVRIAIGNEPPWTELKPDGTLTGAGPDIDRAALEEVGISKYEGVIMEYGAMIPGLQARRVDIVSSGGLNMRPDRCSQVIFSNPVICSGTAFLTKKELLDKAKTYQEVVANGLRVAVPAGSVDEKTAIEKGVTRDHIMNFPDGQSGVKMLQDGRIDVIVLPDAAILDLHKKAADDRLGVVIPVTDAAMNCTGAAFNKEDTALRDIYDAGLAKLIESGKYADIMGQYGLEANARMLGYKTREELCSP
jgi:polar amino acid transport system substrate-binding protein